MPKKGENRGLVTLACSVCGETNYRESKSHKNTPDKLKLNKYCPKCRKTVEHVEKKTK